MITFAHAGHDHHAEPAGPGFLTLFIILGIVAVIAGAIWLVARARSKAQESPEE